VQEDLQPVKIEVGLKVAARVWWLSEDLTLNNKRTFDFFCILN